MLLIRTIITGTPTGNYSQAKEVDLVRLCYSHGRTGKHDSTGRGRGETRNRVTWTVTGPLGVAKNNLQRISDDAPTIGAVKGKVMVNYYYFIK